MSRDKSLFSAGLSEIILIVEDVPKAARFYREVVGLAPEGAVDEHWAWFWAGDPGTAQRVGLHKGTLLYEEYSPPRRKAGAGVRCTTPFRCRGAGLKQPSPTSASTR